MIPVLIRRAMTKTTERLLASTAPSVTNYHFTAEWSDEDIARNFPPIGRQ
jgi:hypothetical protein